MFDVELKEFLHIPTLDYYRREYIIYEHGLAAEMCNWCRDHVSANNWNYYGVYKKRPVMKFRYAEDALAFKIRFTWLQEK